MEGIDTKRSHKVRYEHIDLPVNQHQKSREQMSPRTEETNARIREEQKEHQRGHFFSD